MDNAQTRQPFLGLGGEHGRTVVGHEGARQSPLLEALAQPVAEFFGAFAQIPLGMAAEPAVIVQAAKEQRVGPLAVVQEDPQRAVMKIQVPQGVDILALVAADLAALEARFGNLGARTAGRTPARTLQQAMSFHEPQDRGIAGLGT